MPIEYLLITTKHFDDKNLENKVLSFVINATITGATGIVVVITDIIPELFIRNNNMIMYVPGAEAADRRVLLSFLVQTHAKAQLLPEGGRTGPAGAGGKRTES